MTATESPLPSSAMADTLCEVATSTPSAASSAASRSASAAVPFNSRRSCAPPRLPSSCEPKPRGGRVSVTSSSGAGRRQSGEAGRGGEGRTALAGIPGASRRLTAGRIGGRAARPTVAVGPLLSYETASAAAHEDGLIASQSHRAIRASVRDGGLLQLRNSRGRQPRVHGCKPLWQQQPTASTSVSHDLRRCGLQPLNHELMGGSARKT